MRTAAILLSALLLAMAPSSAPLEDRPVWTVSAAKFLEVDLDEGLGLRGQSDQDRARALDHICGMMERKLRAVGRARYAVRVGPPFKSDRWRSGSIWMTKTKERREFLVVPFTGRDQSLSISEQVYLERDRERQRTPPADFDEEESFGRILDGKLEEYQRKGWIWEGTLILHAPYGVEVFSKVTG